MRCIRVGNLPVTHLDQTVKLFKESESCMDGCILMFEPSFDIWLVQLGNAYAFKHAWFGEIAIFSASIMSYVLIGLLILFLVTRSEQSIKFMILLTVVMVTAWLIARGIQGSWFRARPFDAGIAQALIPHRGSSSFPSTHASVIFAIGWLGFTLRINLYLLGVWWALALVVVTGRVISALHYPSDIIGGLLVGLVSAAVATWLGNRFCKSRT